MSNCATEKTEALDENNIMRDVLFEFQPISITAAAGGFIKEFVEKGKENKVIAVSLSVVKGGCSGKSYTVAPVTQKEFDDRDVNEELIFKEHDVLVMVNKKFSDLSGVEIDLVENTMGRTLKINNPNAKSSCGCGKSYN